MLVTLFSFAAGAVAASAVIAPALVRRSRLLHTDDLTGLHNRAGFEAAVRRHGPGQILIADCNGLKRINDTHGHATGDAVIIAAGEALVQALGPDPVVARLSGDEFAAWLPPTAPLPPPVAAMTATGITARLAIGVCLYTSPTSLGTAMGRADAAMYRHKHHTAPGAGCVMWEPHRDDRASETRPITRLRNCAPVAAGTPMEVAQ